MVAITQSIPAAMMAMGAWSQYGPNNTTIGERPVIFNGSGYPHRLIEVQPEGWYYSETQVLTIEFPVAGFEPYTLSVSSMYNTPGFKVEKGALFSVTQSDY